MMMILFVRSLLKKILKKIRMFGLKPAKMPSVMNGKLMKDRGKKVGDTFYKNLVGNLLYLTTTM
jgi:hypothetical protein